MKKPSVRGRFAPSPSGRMHLGNVFCALMAWLSAKSAKGEILLRIEDLDTQRCRPEYTTQILDDLRFLGLTFDEGEGVGGPHEPYCQSDRKREYEATFRVLQEKGAVYPCFCSRSELHAASAPHTADGRTVYSGKCRSLCADDIKKRSELHAPAYRLCMPREEIVFEDRHYGRQMQRLDREWGDIVVRRSDGIFAYQMAVVADDADMEITEVVRGSDLLSSVAPQVYIYRLLGKKPPVFAHVPLLLAPDGRRLSKRDRDLDMGALRNRFASPEPLIGKLLYLAGLLEKAEPISALEAVGIFSWEKLTKEDITVSSVDF